MHASGTAEDVAHFGPGIVSSGQKLADLAVGDSIWLAEQWVKLCALRTADGTATVAVNRGCTDGELMPSTPSPPPSFPTQPVSHGDVCPCFAGWPCVGHGADSWLASKCSGGLPWMFEMPAAIRVVEFCDGLGSRLACIDGIAQALGLSVYAPPTPPQPPTPPPPSASPPRAPDARVGDVCSCSIYYPCLYSPSDGSAPRCSGGWGEADRPKSARAAAHKCAPNVACWDGVVYDVHFLAPPALPTIAATSPSPPPATSPSPPPSMPGGCLTPQQSAAAVASTCRLTQEQAAARCSCKWAWQPGCALPSNVSLACSAAQRVSGTLVSSPN